MSTRGALGFRLNGEDKITYNHSDSYPSWLGKRVVEWCRKRTERQTWELVKEIVSELEDVSGRTPTEEDKARLTRFNNLRVGEQSEEDWYCLLRETQGDLSAILSARMFNGCREFLDDSLFCEWAYIINLDDMELEVYEGFQKKPHQEGRYGQGKMNDGYAPVRLVVTFPLEDIPEDWEKACGEY